MNSPDSNALVVFSGGQDSTTCLYWAKERFQHVQALTFSYGQRHAIELEAARRVAEYASVPHTIVALSGFDQLGNNSLTGTSSLQAPDQAGLPATFVPGRNLIFMCYAAAFAYSRNITHLVLGVCETDYSGYPDCRAATIKAQENALNLGLEQTFTVHTPLMHLTKAETVLMAAGNGALPALAYSHTCYAGASPPCQECAACVLRANGFREAKIPDPLLVVTDS